MLYYLEYVEKSGEIKCHLRGKGVPKDKLTIELFEQMMKGEAVRIEMTRDFKRIHVNKNTKQKEVENFSILKLESIFKEINKHHGVVDTFTSWDLSHMVTAPYIKYKTFLIENCLVPNFVPIARYYLLRRE